MFQGKGPLRLPFSQLPQVAPSQTRTTPSPIPLAPSPPYLPLDLPPHPLPSLHSQCLALKERKNAEPAHVSVIISFTGAALMSLGGPRLHLLSRLRKELEWERKEREREREQNRRGGSIEIVKETMWACPLGSILYDHYGAGVHWTEFDNVYCISFNRQSILNINNASEI